MEVATIGSPPVWLGFTLFVLALLALDLGVFQRKARAVGPREAGIWSAVWISLALAFNLGILHLHGPERALEFLTGYLIEKALAVDNIFVFYAVFASFAVPAAYQHRVPRQGTRPVAGELARDAGELRFVASRAAR